MKGDKEKLRVIYIIDYASPRLRDSIYGRELKMMRLKYIYKDIGNNEYQNDMEYLKNIIKMIKNN